ncbi:MAG TPA: DNA primase, partial [Lactobacillus acetotolerans]|nr:DNA primase [Lactobacillus acetotolerans]
MAEFTHYEKTIPQGLKNLKQWGLFQLKYLPERHKNTKIPINPYDGTAGKSNDPNTWSTFDEALRQLSKIDRADGLAFYFANGYVGLDVDGIETELKDYFNNSANLVYDIQQMTKNSYREISQSGKGIHVIFKG